MKAYFIAALFFLVVGCHPKINPNVAYNRYLDEFNTYYANDSLRAAMEFPGDIVLGADSILHYKRAFNKMSGLKKVKTDEVIAHGYTSADPHYKLLITLGEESFLPEQNEKTYENEGNGVMALQRPHSEGYLALLGLSSPDVHRNMVADLSRSYRSITTDSAYNPQPAKYPFSYIFDAFDDFEKNDYLRAVEGLYAKRGNYEDSPQSFYQAYLTAACMINGSPAFDSLENLYEQPRRRPQATVANISETALTDEEAIGHILARADTSQVVMFNELHWDRRHRYLVLNLLEEFKKRGFTYLAMEAVFEDSLLNQRGFPVKSTGFYTKEPAMAHMIRQALALGFKVVGYDAQGKKRDYQQAVNLYEKTLKNAPAAKVLVHAGVGHIHEKMDGRSINMAAEFKKNFGIDPLTIDQYILGVSRELEKNNSTVLMSREQINRLFDPGLQTDLYLTSRRQEDYILQPEANFEIEITPIDDRIKKETVSYYTQLYLSDEFESEGFDAIPLYNHWGLKARYKLAPGRYEWMAINRFGEVLQREQLVVK